MELDWRSAKLTKWLRAYDNVYASTKFNNANRPSRGNWMRIRVTPHPGAPKSNKRPPKGLPRNFFRPGYLDTLLKYELAALDVKDEEYSLQHTDEVIA